MKNINKPSLTADQRTARLSWALEHRNWTMDDWKRVIWSDETKINRFNSDGINYALGKRSKELVPGNDR